MITPDDFKAVCDPQTLQVIHQADPQNLQRAIGYAREEVASYLRSRYNIEAAYQQQGADRNPQLVMVLCDVALYHLVAWLPKRIGFEIRELRYNSAIQWLKDVQAGKASPCLPPLTDPATGDDIGNPVRYGGWPRNDYMY